MRSDTQAKKASDRALAASVAKEMDKPRIVQSARLKADEPSKAKHTKRARHPAPRVAKTRIEKYGTGTPKVKDKRPELRENTPATGTPRQ